MNNLTKNMNAINHILNYFKAAKYGAYHIYDEATGVKTKQIQINEYHGPRLGLVQIHECDHVMFLEWLHGEIYLIPVGNNIKIPFRHDSEKWFLKLIAKKNTNGIKYFDLIVCSYPNRNSCVQQEHYNCIDGYWYTPQHEAPKSVERFLKTNKYENIVSLVRQYNNLMEKVSVCVQ